MPASDTVYHIAFLVDALEPAVTRWIESAGAGPFFRFDHFGFVDGVRRGRPSLPDISIAFGYSGPTLIELIEPHAVVGSVFDDGGDGTRLHHLGRLADDFDATLARFGAAVDFTGAFPTGNRVAFADTRDRLGYWTEIIERDPGVDAMLAAMAATHADWDGADAIRRF